jgi:hypothetical protein
VEFNLNYEDFKELISSKCYFCGEESSNILRKKGYDEYKYNGIDRLDNLIGYTVENCVSCCSWCNEAKNDRNIEFFIEKCLKIIHNLSEKEEKYFNIAKERLNL